MIDELFAPFNDLAMLILRLFVGIIFIVHGWPKLNPNSPMKGPAGFAGFLQQLGVPLPIFFAWVVALLETVGAVLFILGLGTRILAVGFAIDMLVATLVAKIRFMKIGFVGQQATGWEFDFLILGVSLALLITGSGALSLDGMMSLPF